MPRRWFGWHCQNRMVIRIVYFLSSRRRHTRFDCDCSSDVCSSDLVPPLRGPDEVAHFLRIHSYARGELLPAVEVGGRKGILIERELHAQLAFFKNAGERFGQHREQGLRYGEIMQEYLAPDGTPDEERSEE